MKVKVRGPYQIVRKGKRHTGGDTLDAPDAEAQRWIRAGWAEKVEPARKAVRDVADKVMSPSDVRDKASSPEATKDETHVCDECGREFASAAALGSHKRSHQG